MRAASEPARRSGIERLRGKLAAAIEQAVGRHDEPEIYGGPAGDLGLVGGPGGMSWEIHADLASLGAAGTAAILLELLHPSVMAGVFTHSRYREDPLSRAQSTLGYVLRTTFGSREAAVHVVHGVRSVHERVMGARGDGVAYRALDPELIAWVHTCIPWAVMTAYDRHARPLSRDERDRYLREQAVIGRMGGAEWVPETVSELEDFVARMRPKLAFNEQTLSFLDFVSGRSEERPVGRAERADRWLGICASMSLAPEWAQRLTGTQRSALVQRALLAPRARLDVRLVRFAVPELPCVRMARERVARGGAVASAA